MSFLEIPLIPQGKVTLAAVDYRIDVKIENNLEGMGIECIKTVKCGELYEAIDGHPDIVMHHTGCNNIVIAPNIYDYMAPVLQKKGFAVTKGATWLVRNYPGNIAYNVLRIGKLAFHNTKYTDVEILKEYEKQNIRVVHVNQGYTKCSVCVLDDKTIITSDLKISSTVEKYGIESLLIKPGGIELKGMNYGFIGGASGLVSENCAAFTGFMDSMESRDAVLNFMDKKGMKIEFLSNSQITDIGSIIPLKC
ncbi:MAG: DUF6873 family GME fold protein [Caulobacteraceae bacterium]